MLLQSKGFLFAAATLAVLVLLALSSNPMGHRPAYAQTPAGTLAATEGSALKAGSTRTDARGVEQVWVPAGCFQMGTGDFTGLEAPDWAEKEKVSEQPQHEVCLTAGYWIDKTEATNASFRAFVDDGGYTKQDLWSAVGWTWITHRDIKKMPVKCVKEDPEYPRMCITWFEAEAYARWRGGRLPSEAEWEFAARGPDSLIYPWANTWDAAKANVVDSKGPMPVGSFPAGASWVGALDMSGNAMEWVNDWLDPGYYKLLIKNDPPGPETGAHKVEKGGWWGSNPFVARGAYRHFEDTPFYQDHHIGFRIVTPAAK